MGVFFSKLELIAHVMIEIIYFACVLKFKSVGFKVESESC